MQTVVLACLLVGIVHGCTVMIITKGASADGSNIVTHTDDAGGGATDIRLVRVPSADWPQGSKRNVYKLHGGYPRIVATDRGPDYQPQDGQSISTVLGTIPQVAHTFGYWENDYGIMNEVGLAIGESTIPARTVGFEKDLSYGQAMMGIGELSRIALERCKTVRCGIQTMGDLAVEHGFFSEDSGVPTAPGYMDSAEGLGLCDRDECWVFNVMTALNGKSAVWAAQRVPDGHVAVIPNAPTVRVIDFNDTANFMHSPDLKQVAEQHGWYKGSGDFDFVSCFGYDYPDETMETILALYSGRRMWRVFDTAAPSLHLDPYLGYATQKITYPFSVKAEIKMSVAAVMALQRDYYEGTQFDMTQGLGAGPYGSPVRYDGPMYGFKGGWERSIYIYRGAFSHVAQVRPDLPDSISGLLWYGHDATATTVYVPVYGSQNTVPESYKTGMMSEWSTESAWWAFNFVGNWIQLRWNAMIVDVRHTQSNLESMGFSLTQQLEEHILTSKLDEKATADLIEQRTSDHINAVVSTYWKFGDYLKAKYSDGQTTTGEEAGQQLIGGYPSAWLRQTEFMNYPPVKPPVEIGAPYHPYTPVLKDHPVNQEGSPTNAASLPAQQPSEDIPLLFLVLLVGSMAGAGVGFVAGRRAAERKSYAAMA